MPEAKTYTGGCHCGVVRYEATTDLGRVVSCNCSHCIKRGLVLSFVPAGQFTLRSGDRDLLDHQFNKKVIHHLFCRHCGIESFARGTTPEGGEMVALNVRCLDGVDLASVNPIPVDGRSF
jgi:hypothetical protein